MRYLGFIVLLAMLAGCSASHFQQGRRLSEAGNYGEAVEFYQQELLFKPNNADALRELGVAYYHLDDSAKAEELLRQSNQIDPDVRTYLHLGLLYEKAGEEHRAIDSYRYALAFKPSKDLRHTVRSHMNALLMSKMRREAKDAIDEEGKIVTAETRENVIGVYDFETSHLAEEVVPLAKGLAELTSIDLDKVESLETVERIKIAQVLNELHLAGVEAPQGPEFGKIIGAANLVHGTVLGIGRKIMEIDGAISSTSGTPLIKLDPLDDKLKKCFELQKELVFQVVDSLKIKLSPDERAAIRRIPTESYLAFLAYSRGLEFRDKGMYEDAEREFNAAVNHDGGFDEAREMADFVADVDGFDSGETPGGFEQFEQASTAESNNDQEIQSLEDFTGDDMDVTGFINDDSTLHHDPPNDRPRTGTRAVQLNIRASARSDDGKK